MSDRLFDWHWRKYYTWRFNLWLCHQFGHTAKWKKSTITYLIKRNKGKWHQEGKIVDNLACTRCDKWFSHFKAPFEKPNFRDGKKI